QENRALKNHLEDEKKEKKQYAKEKEILIKEIKNLRKRPQSVEELKSEVNEFESRSRENQSRYQDLLTEYNTLTQSYEKILTDQSGKDEEERLPEKIIQELEEELQELKNEKKELQKELNDEKRLFEISLAREIRRIEKDWENKIKRLKTEKIRVTRFADQIIEEGEAPVWLITYSDMATLLLTFFILYYSIAAVNLDRFKEAILGTEEASIGLLELLDSLEIEESIQEFTGLKSDNILSDITDVVQTQGDVGTSESKIVVRVPGATLFPSGSAALQKSGQPVLDEVIRIFKKYQRYKIHIQGHTDDIPISTDRFPTNWELSAARATAVLRYFIDRGIEAERLTATGYADTFPLVPNETPIGRAKNRRVEFVLEKE
ncbi:MAG: OmpA family protein, partial [Nitrospinaceae bacterium]|nr:OmpA family protein [Nitrospinaceae bacterium]NIR57071.1 OmpA family protein [Nitrospinaceae bacterium]NIS87512.1 OmpA family protein [Nitrospinaceae bacterium]NIT84382.1 OmpA family protein [Nitrospinaceae bacterium]NIU46569.1 OmpA family protein [Nitrospinaceae bacterium]